jgi:hypothetical protein
MIEETTILEEVVVDMEVVYSKIIMEGEVQIMP